MYSFIVLKIHPANWPADNFWLAVASGFSGSLSTVSTFIAELKSEKLAVMLVRESYLILSFSLSMLVLLPALHSYRCSATTTTMAPLL